MTVLTPKVGVIGIVKQLPMTVPLERRENAGNIVHGQAPFSMFPDSVHAGDRTWPGAVDGESFAAFVNRNCSHLIYTVANLFRLNSSDPGVVARFEKMQEIIERFEVPLVAFGVGAQSTHDDISKVSLHPSGVRALQLLTERATAISVRGEFTASVFEKYADTKKVFVTGCPSFYSRPDAFKSLRRRLRTDPGFCSEGIPSYNGTRYENHLEKQLFFESIRRAHFMVEPLYPEFHQLHLDALIQPDKAHLPAPLGELSSGFRRRVSRRRILQHFASKYRFFRTLDSWIRFNQEYVSLTYGTRFHVNMASLLSGVPALWLTHDSRTRELADALSLPNLPLEHASEGPWENITRAVDYEPLFDTLHEKFDKFNDFLDAADLPGQKLDF